ncbi:MULTISPECIES: hypothetical protein [Pelosinus]|uniref:Uncharacterized protein n=2 Tax=Pelosinus TaxID=365348 RepID=I9DK97_9FIRM|nr:MULTISPECIES: hypothetical protein [Pelosinus]AJQ27280.1 hypothetical protein JBW_01930 [Pelosinus fermentans JBW45]MCC5467781.1 hypothetical protein [Pelosinus baikalensis]
MKKTTKPPHKTQDVSSKQGEKGKTKASWPSSKVNTTSSAKPRQPEK